MTTTEWKDYVRGFEYGLDTAPSIFGIPVVLTPFVDPDEWLLLTVNNKRTLYVSEATMRKFDTGATRDTDTNKPDYEGFLSPLVMEGFGAYMQKNRVQADGNLRDSDNWQKGIPLDAYLKSAFRHFISWWAAHRRGKVEKLDELYALMFNVQGYIHETLKAQQAPVEKPRVSLHLLAGRGIPVKDVNQPFQEQLNWVATRTPYADELGIGLAINIDTGVIEFVANRFGVRHHVYIDPAIKISMLDSMLTTFAEKSQTEII